MDEVYVKGTRFLPFGGLPIRLIWRLSKVDPHALRSRSQCGLEFKTKHVTIAPEVRWNRVFSGSGTRDQFSVMVGFRFGR